MGLVVSKEDVDRCMEAMWDNLQDGRQAVQMGISFEEIELMNRALFEAWLKMAKR